MLFRVIPAAAFALLVLAAPASAASQTDAAGPSATPLILELALAAVVGAALALRGPAGRALAKARRRLAAARPRLVRARARG